MHLVVAKINLSKREKAVKDAVRDVCAQFDRGQVRVVPHIWDSNSSAGPQVVDYGLWAIRRHVLSRWQSKEKLRSAIRFHGKTPVVFLSPILRSQVSPPRHGNASR